MEANTTVILKKGEGRTIKAGGAWIYDNEIASIHGSFKNGSIIRVEDFDGYFMGKGFINQNSKIRVRMLTRKDEPVDNAFLNKRLRMAWEYRKTVMGADVPALRLPKQGNGSTVSPASPQTVLDLPDLHIGDTGRPDLNCCRLIFGEADGFPGLVVDKYSDVLVVECLALGMEFLKATILALLIEILEEDGIHIRGIYERSDAPVRKKEGLTPYKGFFGEAFDTNIPIVENGVRYLVDVMNGQKTGFFLDQKYNRLAMQRICAGKERVLDCFTHMGTFALNAGLAGAKEVTGLDISEYAISQAVENARRNHLEDRVHFRTANVLDELPRLYEAGERYDVVILDPPAFTKSREATKNALKGYREINMKGMRLVKDGGYLATCSCSHFMTQDLFAKVIGQAAQSTHKKLRQVEFRTQSPDHPILWNAEESYYLKFFIFQVLS